MACGIGATLRPGGRRLEKKVFIVFAEAEINELYMIVQDRDEQAAYVYLKQVLLKKLEEALRKSCR